MTSRVPFSLDHGWVCSPNARSGQPRRGGKEDDTHNDKTQMMTLDAAAAVTRFDISNDDRCPMESVRSIVRYKR